MPNTCGDAGDRLELMSLRPSPLLFPPTPSSRVALVCGCCGTTTWRMSNLINLTTMPHKGKQMHLAAARVVAIFEDCNCYYCRCHCCYCCCYRCCCCCCAFSICFRGVACKQNPAENTRTYKRCVAYEKPTEPKGNAI